jgi:hypothetical protein
MAWAGESHKDDTEACALGAADVDRAHRALWGRATGQGSAALGSFGSANRSWSSATSQTSRSLAKQLRKWSFTFPITAERAYIERKPRVVALVDGAGARTMLLVPMLKEGELVGSIVSTASRYDRSPISGSRS